MKKGHIAFELNGHKLHGRWHLVRLKPRPGEKRDNWLLIKSDDAAARPGTDILQEAPQSVKSGLTIEEVGEGKTADGRKPKVWQSNKPVSKPVTGKAKAAGGAIDPSPVDDYSFMYGRSFEDPDGHLWGVNWMDKEAVAKQFAKTA